MRWRYQMGGISPATIAVASRRSSSSWSFGPASARSWCGSSMVAPLAMSYIDEHTTSTRYGHRTRTAATPVRHIPSVPSGGMRVVMILPALTEATSPFFRPVKYSLFPPLGLATLAAYLQPDDEATIVDEHVEPLTADDTPDLVVIQVYITNAYRAYRLADGYRARGVFVALGGLHVTSLPDEAAPHA